MVERGTMVVGSLIVERGTMGVGSLMMAGLVDSGSQVYRC